jgi:hypothetical protein
VAWLQQIHYTQPAQDATLLDCLNEVQHLEERVKRLEEAIVGCGETGSTARAGSDPGFANIARRGAYLGSDDCRRVGQHLLRFESARQLMGYSGTIPSRRLQWQAQTARKHHQDRQRAPATNRGRIGLELSTPAIDRSSIAQATGGSFSRDHRSCMESAEPPTPALHEADGCRQGPEEDHHGDRTRTHGLYLGHRNQGRSRLQQQVAA